MKVDKSIPFWRQKLDLFRFGVVPTDPAVCYFDPPVDPVPMTVTVRLPTMAQRVAEFTRLGSMPQGVFDDLDEDDFQDHLDDLPPEGLSPHEDRTYVHLHTYEASSKASKKVADAPKGASPTSPTGAAAAAPTAKQQDAPEPAA